MNTCARKAVKHQDGFSLIEVAIALLIVGLILVPIMMIYNVEQQQAVKDENRGKLFTIQLAINEFAARENRYPMPADLFLGPADTNYGLEYSSASPVMPCPSWPTADGVCRVPGANPILIGAVPFEALGINPDMAHDYWGHKILYAVTEAETVNYDPAPGAITVRAVEFDDATSTRNAVNLVRTYDIFLVSHGETAQGAYNRDGVLVRPCVGATPHRDDENCNMDGTFFAWENPDDSLNGFPVTSYSQLDNNEFYDDFTFEIEKVTTGLWTRNIMDATYALTYSSAIGVGTSNPTAKLHVVGNIEADELSSDQVCNAAGVCFSPEIISGALNQMNCNNMGALTTGQAVVNIRNSSVVCTSPVDGSGLPVDTADGNAFAFPTGAGGWVNPVDCTATGQLMIGLDASGNPRCATPP